MLKAGQKPNISNSSHGELTPIGVDSPNEELSQKDLKREIPLECLLLQLEKQRNAFKALREGSHFRGSEGVKVEAGIEKAIATLEDLLKDSEVLK